MKNNQKELVKPFVKWVGGKRKLLPEIIAVAFYVIFVILAAVFGFHTWKGLK